MLKFHHGDQFRLRGVSGPFSAHRVLAVWQGTISYEVGTQLVEYGGCSYSERIVYEVHESEVVRPKGNL